MTVRLSDDARNAAVDAVADLFDAGAAAGYLEIRSGTQPATVAIAASGTLLATLTLSDPAFAAATLGDAAANTITEESSANATGTAGWFRVYDSDATAVLDGAVGLSGSGAELILDTVAITAGDTVEVDSWALTLPAS